MRRHSRPSCSAASHQRPLLVHPGPVVRQELFGEWADVLLLGRHLSELEAHSALPERHRAWRASTIQLRPCTIILLQRAAAGCTHTAAAAALTGSSRATRPSTSSITRSQRAAERGSCVTTRNEIRSSACMRRINAKTSSDDA